MTEGERFRRDIAFAVAKAKSGQNAEELYRSPGLKMYRYGENTGSWRKRGDAVEVVHLRGHWTKDAVEAFTALLVQDMKEMGCSRVAWVGRPAWRRFLRMKGFL